MNQIMDSKLRILLEGLVQLFERLEPASLKRARHLIAFTARLRNDREHKAWTTFGQFLQGDHAGCFRDRHIAVLRETQRLRLI